MRNFSGTHVKHLPLCVCVYAHTYIMCRGQISPLGEIIFTRWTISLCYFTETELLSELGAWHFKQRGMGQPALWIRVSPVPPPVLVLEMYAAVLSIHGCWRFELLFSHLRSEPFAHWTISSASSAPFPFYFLKMLFILCACMFCLHIYAHACLNLLEPKEGLDKSLVILASHYHHAKPY